MMKRSPETVHSIGVCPVCEGGNCGVRVCTGDDPTEIAPGRGFVMCDECEAIWLEPDVTAEHVYADPEQPLCPICQAGLWGASRWAELEEIAGLGWSATLNAGVSPNTDRNASC